MRAVKSKIRTKTIHELVEEKHYIEGRIKRYVESELEDFEERTGCCPYDVDIQLTTKDNLTTFSGSYGYKKVIKGYGKDQIIGTERVIVYNVDVKLLRL